MDKRCKQQKKHNYTTKCKNWQTQHSPRTATQLPSKHQQFAEANYVTVFMPEEVNFFNGQQASITSTHQPILQGWRDPATGLWQIPIKPAPTSNPIYEPAPTEHDKQQIQQKMNNVYKLPRTGNKVLPCNGRVSNKNNMDQSNKSGFLCNLTHANSNSHHKIFPRVR